MLVPGQRRRPHPPQHFTEGGPAVQIRAHHQRIQEETEYRFHLCPLAVGHHRAYTKILLPGIPHQQHLAHRQQRHE